MPRIVRLSAITALLPALVAAQLPPAVALDSGTLIRLHQTVGPTVRGRLVSPLTAASPAVVYCPYPGPRCATALDSRITRIPASQVTGLDVVASTRWKAGAAIGGAIGLGLAAAYISAGATLCETSSCRAFTWRTAALSFGLSLGVGVALGASSIEWRPVR